MLLLLKGKSKGQGYGSPIGHTKQQHAEVAGRVLCSGVDFQLTTDMYYVHKQRSQEQKLTHLKRNVVYSPWVNS